MLKTPIARGVALATLGATLAIPTMAQAAFIEDTKAGLELRNFYFNRDYREGAGQNKQDEWAQGFILRVESGFTEGTVGFGIDALGLLGVKLDSGRGSVGSGLLPGAYTGAPGAPSNPTNNAAPDDYSSLGLAAKFKVSDTILKVGTLQPKNMAISSSDSRLLPQTFQGAQVVSKEIAGLTLDGGFINRANHRNSSNNEGLAYGGKGTGTTGGASSAGISEDADDFFFAGGSYKVVDNLTAGYYLSLIHI